MKVFQEIKQIIKEIKETKKKLLPIFKFFCVNFNNNLR